MYIEYNLPNVGVPLLALKILWHFTLRWM